MSKLWLETGLVFTNRHGEAVGPGVVNRALVRALLDARLPRIRVHDLRHTTTSVLLEAGTHPKVVQDLLGHSTIQLTLDTYSHVTPALHRRAARTMDLLLTRLAPHEDQLIVPPCRSRQILNATAQS